MKFCTRCGAQLEDSSKFCTSCGAPCEEPTPSQDSKKKLIIGIAAGVIALVVTAILFVVFVFGGQSNEDAQATGAVQIQGEQSVKESDAAEEDSTQKNASENESTAVAPEETTGSAAASSDEGTIPYLSSNVTGSYPGLVVPFTDISASSTLETSSYGTYYASNVSDGNNSTAWVEGDPGSGAGSEITFVNLTSHEPLTEMAIFNGYCKSKDLYYVNARPHQITIFADGVPIGTTSLVDEYSALQVVTFAEPVYPNQITLRIDSVYEGSRHADCCISEIGFR